MKRAIKEIKNIKLKYRINIIWSNEDNCYLVSLPDFTERQWRTYGKIYSEAFEHGLEVMKNFI